MIRGLSSQSNTYHFILKHQDEFYISATPERLIKVADGHLTTGAVAGTIQRGDNEQDDMSLGKLLLASHKKSAGASVRGREYPTEIASYD